MSRPTRLKSQLETIQRENADLVVSGVRAVDQEGTTVWRGTMTTDGDLFRKTLAMRNPTVHSTWFLRTDTFTKIGCYDEHFKGAEDFELLQRIARQGTIAFVPDELVDYLVRTGSVLSASRGVKRLVAERQSVVAAIYRGRRRVDEILDPTVASHLDHVKVTGKLHLKIGAQVLDRLVDACL
jgi:hypothetical protein